MRIAWTGSAVGDRHTNSAAALGAMLLGQLLDDGIEVDLYYPATRDQVPPALRDHRNLTVIDESVRFEWDRWYSRTRVTVLLSSLVARSLTQVRLGWRLIRNHRRRRYDAIFQFSQMELFIIGWASRLLPPIVVHPCTTASRELLWHQRESRYALQSESRVQHYMVRTYLKLRTVIQRQELKKPRIVAGPSQTYNRLLSDDYRVDPSRTRVLRHPVDVARFSGVERNGAGGKPIVLLFVSRLSARKGLELVVGLSHRLADLAGEVEIKIFGGGSLWSDYSAHLAELNAVLADHVGSVSPDAMPEVYGDADVLLVPSHYEPGSLVVGEALAAGLPVVASDQVGPVEVVDGRVCRVYPDGDLDAFEREVRALVADLRGDGEGAIAAIARHEAHERFGPDHIGRHLVGILDEAAASTR